MHEWRSRLSRIRDDDTDNNRTSFKCFTSIHRSQSTNRSKRKKNAKSFSFIPSFRPPDSLLDTFIGSPSQLAIDPHLDSNLPDTTKALPPSAKIVTPFTNAPPLPVRKRAVPEISSAVPARPSGIPSFTLNLVSS